MRRTDNFSSCAVKGDIACGQSQLPSGESVQKPLTAQAEDSKLKRNAYTMGRSYWFECSKCGYRAKVSGRGERGLNFAVQTILCRDCKQLFDAVTGVRVPDTAKEQRLGMRLQKVLTPARSNSTPPTFESVLNRLPFKGVKQYKWLRFKSQCPVSSYHRVEDWNSPAKCPRCGVFMEQ